MDKLRARELVMIKLSEMEDCETVSDLDSTYLELKRLLRYYKQNLVGELMYNGKETTENDN